MFCKAECFMQVKFFFVRPFLTSSPCILFFVQRTLLFVSRFNDQHAHALAYKHPFSGSYYNINYAFVSTSLNLFVVGTVSRE